MEDRLDDPPHLFVQREIDATSVLVWKNACLARKTGLALSLTDVTVDASACALVRHTHPRSRSSADGFVMSPSVDVDIAVAVDGGARLAVRRAAEVHTVDELARPRAAVVGRARTARLEPYNVGGGVFTVSAPQISCVDVVRAILNPQVAAILAVGQECSASWAVAGVRVEFPGGHVDAAVRPPVVHGSLLRRSRRRSRIARSSC